MPFFKKTALPLIQPKSPVAFGAQCGLCGLLKTCLSPKMPVSGEGNKKVLIVAESPGEEEDRLGKQLVGNSGRELMKVLRSVGYDMRRDCWLTSSLICRPPNNEITNDNWIDYCRPNLITTIEKLQPNVIILLGGVAVNSLMPHIWKDKNISGITTWAGWTIPSVKINSWVCPTYHPSYLLRMESDLLNRDFRFHLHQAMSLAESRPHKQVPDYKSMVNVIISPTEAGQAIIKLCRESIEHKLPVAFDYETNCLKPESNGAKIYCCSMSNGRTTIAYPWHGDAIVQTKRFLQSSIPKIASNLNFENKWTKTHLGFFVSNWFWDTSLDAHVLDNREGITSIKFQSFVHLGVEAYNTHIEPYLNAANSVSLNRVHEIDLKSLLLYCGLDSLYEYMVARVQRNIFRERGSL